MSSTLLLAHLQADSWPDWSRPTNEGTILFAIQANGTVILFPPDAICGTPAGSDDSHTDRGWRQAFFSGDYNDVPDTKPESVQPLCAPAALKLIDHALTNPDYWLRDWLYCRLRVLDEQIASASFTKGHRAERNELLIEMGLLRPDWVDAYQAAQQRAA